jgi:hypothetical protein
MRILWVLFLLCTGPLCSAAGAQPGGKPVRQGLEQILPEPADRDFPVYLYFADKNNRYLVSEMRDIPPREPRQDYCREIVEALISGPSGAGIETLPKETAVRAVYLTADGVAYVDLTPAVSADHPGGVRTELMTVYSIVNTLALNVSAVDRVKILVGGKEADTLAGHIDIRHPLQADMLLVR